MRKVHFKKTNIRFVWLTAFLCFISFFFIQDNIFAQVSIKETVTLNPKITTSNGPDYDILALDDYLCLGDQSFLVISAPYEVYQQYRDSIIMLEIISGNKSASFYNINSYMGDTVYVLFRWLDVIRIHHDTLGSSTATIRATLSNVVSTTDINLSCGGGGEGECSLESYPVFGVSTLRPGESIILQASQMGSCPPPGPDFSYNIRIIQGSEYGTLLNIYTGEKADQFNEIHPYDLSWLAFLFLADGEIPELAKQIKIHIGTSDASIPSSLLTLSVNPSIEAVVQFIPDTLAPGDTANILIKKRNEDLSLSNFPPEATFEIGMLDGCVNGTILTEAGTGSYFFDIPQPVKFIAADSIEGDSGTVKLKIGIVNDGEIIATKNVKDNKNKTFKSNKNLYKVAKNYMGSQIETCFAGDFNTFDYWVGDVVLGIENTPQVLLGESKYYQAKFNMEEMKIKIEEIIPDEQGVPHQKSGMEGDWDWITEKDHWAEVNVWGENPVGIIRGDKPGVYWEREKPIWGKSETLDPGLIRIIGRYWEEDKAYKVKLTTSGAPPELAASIIIEVMKPEKITSTKYKKLPTTIKDVDGSNINLDNLIIEYAGKSGILPQIIKAQMLEESTFRAAYRYEPFSDAAGVQSDYRYTNNRYKVKSAADIGSPSIPATHTNVRPHDYWRYQGTIWDFFYAHSSTLNKDIAVGSGDDLYPQTNSRGRVLWYSKPRNKWNETYTKTYTEQIANKKNENEAIDLARDEANKWLKEQYNGGIMKTGIAQTRMAASYGILQVTYYRALEEYGYTENNDNYPERLNEVEFALKFWQDILLGYLTKEKVSSSDNNEYNWRNGYETTLRYALGRYRGIRTDSYGESIINNSKKFNIE
ncbi:MAG: hypothetical protein R6W90_01805 [Ignavibacteriaceae bacterium]